MTSQFNGLLVLIFFAVIIFLLRVLLGRLSKRPCRICGQKTEEELCAGKNRQSLCRVHLLNEFKDGFLKYCGKAIVFYPDLEERKSFYTYGGYSLEEFPNLFRIKNGEEILLKTILDRIHDSCTNCGKTAKVVFLDKGSFGWIYWDKEPHFPDFKNVPTQGLMLCLKCAWEKIEPSLRRFPGVFNNGVFLPPAEKVDSERVYCTCLV